ncbi:FeoA family protein [Tepidibacter formicigenes]|jgi:ferrous iron transport protein A|uniref:Ferrous iron transport protein A n=1 Tax=Tepidibacter formicigenes DSM 15518 TaxID=1123349 RepID=A0A1M6S5T7_9FIRM|nr:FeoA family protein [Tepidibacter formicigenes]SHK39898.1 ferrous iron transport protein A [Tepidibacter formicigenes DSM 15518]
MVKTLRNLKPGESGVVSIVKGKGSLKRRLMDMGIIKGTDIYVEKVAPLGDPIEVKVKGYNLTLRKEDAENILVD